MRLTTSTCQVRHPTSFQTRLIRSLIDQPIFALSHPLIFDYCGPHRCFRKAAGNLSLLPRAQKVQERGGRPSPAVGGNMAATHQEELQRVEIASQKNEGIAE